MRTSHLILFCSAWFGIGCCIMAAFPGSAIASALGYSCLLFTMAATCFENVWGGGKGFAVGFMLGAVGGGIYGFGHPLDPSISPGGFVGALSGGLTGLIVGAMVPFLFWPLKLFRPLSGKDQA